MRASQVVLKPELGHRRASGILWFELRARKQGDYHLVNGRYVALN